MLVPVIRKSVLYNLRRIVACVSYRNRTKAKTARYCNESDLLSTSLSNSASCRIYSTEPDSGPQVSLPMLVDGNPAYIPSFLTPLKLLYLSTFRIIPYIDKDFNAEEFLKGAKYATIMISKALANEDFESLDGLVAEDMIKTLRTKIQTLSPNQRQLIALNDNDILFYILSDIAVSKGRSDEHSIQITIMCHYIPGLEKKRDKMSSTGLVQFSKSVGYLICCNYIFTRKYVNNIGGPWIATFVNHYTMS